MKYKLVIFDLDGTILNTIEDLTDCTNYALDKNKFQKRTIKEVRSFVGNGIAKLIDRAVPVGTSHEETEQVLRDFTTYYANHCADKTRPYDGVLELLIQLKQLGILTAVVSNKADFAVQELCKQYFPNMFDFVVGERHNIRRKPAPDSVLEVLDKLHIDKMSTVYVGDSEVDIQTAKNASIDIISVSWGFRDRIELIAQGAIVVVDKPIEILHIVNEG